MKTRRAKTCKVVADLVKQLGPDRATSATFPAFDGEKYHVEFDDSHYSPPSSFANSCRPFARNRPVTAHPSRKSQHMGHPARRRRGHVERWGPVLQREEWDACLKYDTGSRPCSRLNGRIARWPTTARPSSITIFRRPASTCSRLKGTRRRLPQSAPVACTR